MEENMSIMISEFMHGNRTATVMKSEEKYIVYMYEGEALREARPIVGHTEDYVEEAAENWVLGIIK